MDDGGRCLADVISDPKLLQSFLEDDNGANGQVDGKHVLVASKIALSNEQPPNNSNQRLTATAEEKHSDHVTSTKENNSSQLTGGQPRPESVGGGLTLEDKSTVNVVSSSVGLIPLSGIPTAAVNSISLSQPATVTTFSAASTPLRTTSPAVSWPPSSIQMNASRNIGPTMAMQLPQQLIVPTASLPLAQTSAGLSQIVLTSPRPGTAHSSQALPAGIQPGQLVQIIQTPTGTQMIPASVAPTTIQQVPTTSSSSTSKSPATTNTSRSNKQILPKPPGSGHSNSGGANAGKNSQLQQSNSLKVINNLQPASSTTQFATPTLPTSAASPQQIIIGGGQPQPVIAGPQGTFLLNHLIPGLGPQQILIQGNIGNVPGSVQLTLRPQPTTNSPMVSVGGANLNTDQNSALLSALATGPQTQVKTSPAPPTSQTQTFVIPNHAASVNGAPGMMFPTGQGGVVMAAGARPAPNIILTRPQHLLGSPSQQPQPVTGQQFLQIQTPNGPVLVALQTSMTNQPVSVAQTSTVQSHNNQTQAQLQLSNTMIPFNASPTIQSHAHPALQALLSQQTDAGNGQTIIQTSMNSVPTSNTVFLAPQNQLHFTSRSQQQQPQQTSPSFIVSGQQQTTKTTAPSLNLAELLKETGILPDSSPPTSPGNNPTDITNMVNDGMTQANASQPTVLMVQNQPNIVLTQSPVAANPPQLRLAVAPDGSCSVILQPQISSNVQQQLQTQPIQTSRSLNDSLKDTSGLGSSQPSPDSTTPTLDATSTTVNTCSTVSVTTTTATNSVCNNSSSNNSALLDQLNTAPAMKVPDLVASIALQNGGSLSDDQKNQVAQQSLIPLTVQNMNMSINNSMNGTVVGDGQRQTILTIPVANGESAAATTPSNAVIRIGNCDNLPTSLVLTTPANSVFPSPIKSEPATVLSPSSHTNNGNNGSTTVIDQNGVPMVQVSPNNQEFLQRLDTQLKALLAVKSPTQQQRDLLNELMALQDKLNQARQSQGNSEEQKLLLTTPQVIQLAPQSQAMQQQKAAPNVHLVNLLNQSPVNQNSTQQIRLLTTPVTATTANTVNGTTTIQLGNQLHQLITFTTPAKQIQNTCIRTLTTNATQIIKPQMQTSAQTVILRLQTPTTTTSTTPIKTSNKQVDHHSEQEKRNMKILKSIQQQLSVDQAAALKPDTKKPFKSRDDAVKRLLRYHVFNTPTMTQADLEKSDELFEVVAQHLLAKKQQLFDKFRVLLLKQSIKETASSEHVMLDRMFISEETNSLKTDKEIVSEGKSLDLPPMPESWYQMLRISIEEEEQKLNINRKRKSSISIDEEYCGQTHRTNNDKHHLPNVESEESEDEEEDSDDEEDDEDDDDHQMDKDAMSNYLTGVDEHISDVDNYYSNVDYDQNLQISGANGSVPLNNYPNGTATNEFGMMYSDMSQDNADEWTNNLMANPESRRISWSPRYSVQESEAAVAVESILTGEDEAEGDISVDLSGIDGLDDNLDDDNEEEDDEEGDDEDDDEDDEEEDEFSMVNDGSHQRDVQMQCAIKSILDIPVQQPPAHSGSYLHSDGHHHPQLNDYRGYYMPQSRFQRHHLTGSILPDCAVNRHASCANDLILDEAVKSILP